MDVTHSMESLVGGYECHGLGWRGADLSWEFTGTTKIMLLLTEQEMFGNESRRGEQCGYSIQAMNQSWPLKSVSDSTDERMRMCDSVSKLFQTYKNADALDRVSMRHGLGDFYSSPSPPVHLTSIPTCLTNFTSFLRGKVESQLLASR